MKITYKPLWKLLIDRGIKKGELCTIAKISPATVTKMGSGKHITTETIIKICAALDCGITDIMDIERGEQNVNTISQEKWGKACYKHYLP